MTDTAPRKASIFDLYETDRDAEENGKWFDEQFGPEIAMKIRRYSSEKSRKMRESIFKAALKAYKTADKIPEALATDLAAKHLAEAVVTDWKGIFGRDGVEIPFSTDRAYELFSQLPDFARDVILVSIGQDNFKAQTEGEIKGN